MYLNLTVKDFFESFESPQRISQFLAEGFATNNCFLVGSATEELIEREEDAIIAVVVRGATEGEHFKIDSPLAANFSYVLSTADGQHPILQAINRDMHRAPKDKLWVERAVASAVEPSRCFETDQELVKWFQDWLKDDEHFVSRQAPTPDVKERPCVYAAHHQGSNVSAKDWIKDWIKDQPEGGNEPVIPEVVDDE